MYFRCTGGYLRLWDGLQQPGRYPYPPNTLCGDYDTDQINVDKYSTQPLAEIEFWTEDYHRHVTFSLTYKYINLGKSIVNLVVHVVWWPIYVGACLPCQLKEKLGKSCI